MKKKTKKTVVTTTKEAQEENNIKVRVVYSNFKDKYTKKVYEVDDVINISEKRLAEILKVEETKNVKLVETIIDETANIESEVNDGDDNTQDNNFNENENEINDSEDIIEDEESEFNDGGR